MSQPLYSNLGFEQPLEIAKGSTFKIELAVFADVANRTPYDLTGCEMRAVLQSLTNPDEKYAFIFNGVLGPDGIAQGMLTSTATAALVANDKRLAPPMYRWACEFRTPQNEVIPFCYGFVTVRSNGIDW